MGWSWWGPVRPRGREAALGGRRWGARLCTLGPGWASGPVPRLRYGWGWGGAQRRRWGGPGRTAGAPTWVCVYVVCSHQAINGLVGSTTCADTHGPISSLSSLGPSAILAQGWSRYPLFTSLLSETCSVFTMAAANSVIEWTTCLKSVDEQEAATEDIEDDWRQRRVSTSVRTCCATLGCPAWSAYCGDQGLREGPREASGFRRRRGQAAPSSGAQHGRLQLL